MNHDLYAAAELMSGLDPGHVGGPAKRIAPNPVPDVGPLGQGRPERIVQFKALNEAGRHMLASPRPLSVSLAAASATPPGFPQGPLVAILQWGSGSGGPQTAEIDVPFNNVTGTGGLIATVLGDYINVSVRNDASVMPRGGDDPLGDLRDAPTVTVSLAVGSRSGELPVTLTKYGAFKVGGGLAPAGTALVLVPAFARRYRVFRSDAAQTVTVSLAANNGVLVDGPYNVAANAPAPTLPIVANGNFVVVVNTGAVAIAAVGVIFELGL